MPRTWLALRIMVALFLLHGFAGWVGSTAIGSNSSLWHASWMGPWQGSGHSFRMMWTSFYISAALPCFFAYQQPHTPARSWALIAHALQLFAHFIWTFLFFALKSPWLALLDSMVVLLCVVCSAISMARMRGYILWFLFPYGGWVVYVVSWNVFALLRWGIEGG